MLIEIFRARRRDRSLSALPFERGLVPLSLQGAARAAAGGRGFLWIAARL